MNPHFFADPDPKSQNNADPADPDPDPDPKHWPPSCNLLTNMSYGNALTLLALPRTLIPAVFSF